VRDVRRQTRSAPRWEWSTLKTRQATRIGATAAVIGVLVSAAGWADVPGTDSATAQVLFDAAKKLVAAGMFVDACPKFEESQRLDPTSGTLINLADCYEKAGRISAAWSAFVDASAMSRRAGNAQREQAAKERALALEPKLSKIVITVKGGERVPDLQVKRDGTIVGKAQWGLAVPADQGVHTVTVSAPGRKTWVRSVTINAAGSTLTIDVPELEPSDVGSAPRPAPQKVEPPAAAAGSTTAGTSTAREASGGMSNQKIGSIAAASVGVAGVVVGSVFGLKAMSTHKDAENQCTPQCYDQAGVDLKDQSMRAGNVATIAFVVGGVGLAGAAVLWFSDNSVKPTSPQVGIGPSGLIVKGAW
jgi:hypothetical protein